MRLLLILKFYFSFLLFSQSNIGGMRAASQLLSSLSDFPATRRAWRRDAFELLLDPTFFSVDVDTLRHWRNIIDNLMCHDKDAFREFLGRVSVSPSGLFSSRELEMEMRTTLLKRLAFTLFCTDGDQYQRFLPEIQGNYCHLNLNWLINNWICFLKNRKTIREFAIGSNVAECPGASISLLPGAVTAHISTARHFFMAFGHCRNGSSPLAVGTRIAPRNGRV